MTLPFLHEHAEFQDLLSIVSDAVHVSAALVEKDYWVTHTLWALESQGFRVFFKGGTSLSKGFQLIERFSEDLDVKLQANDLPAVENWTSEGNRATAARQAYFAALEQRLRIPGAQVAELEELRDPCWRNAVFAIHYPSQPGFQLPVAVRPFVQLEVGSARVTPGVDRPITVRGGSRWRIAAAVDGRVSPLGGKLWSACSFPRRLLEKTCPGSPRSSAGSLIS